MSHNFVNKFNQWIKDKRIITAIGFFLMLLIFVWPIIEISIRLQQNLFVRFMMFRLSFLIVSLILLIYIFIKWLNENYDMKLYTILISATILFASFIFFYPIIVNHKFYPWDLFFLTQELIALYYFGTGYKRDYLKKTDHSR